MKKASENRGLQAGYRDSNQEQLKAPGWRGFRPRIVENPRFFAVLMGVHRTDGYRLVTANLVTSEGNLVTKVVTAHWMSQRLMPSIQRLSMSAVTANLIGATDRISAEHRAFALLALKTNEEGASWTSCC